MKRVSPVSATCILLALLGTTILHAAEVDGKGQKIYYIRHAQTMGNVTHNYTEENQCTFSDLGKEQIKGVPEKLAQYEFDYIAVSPTWRTRQTILPYLKANRRMGVIWPEIEEGGCDLRGKVKPAKDLPKGEAVEILPENGDFFMVRDEDSKLRYAPTDNAESYGVFQLGVDKMREQFGGTGKNILLVCHSCTGSRIFELLLGVRPKGRFGPQNAAVTLLEDRGNGVFELIQFNDEPFEQYYYWTTPAYGEDFAATKRVNMKLNAQYFGPASAEDYRVVWTLKDDAGEVADEGEKTFKLERNTEETLTSIEVSTRELKPSDECTLETSLFRGTELLSAWDMDFVIKDYYELKGAWRIMKGNNSAWSAQDYDDSGWLYTEVPGSWENDAYPDYDGMAWYRHRFTIPPAWFESWGDKPLAIMLGAIDDADVSYLNGEKIGQTGKMSPDCETAFKRMRVYPVARELLMQPDGENTLAVHVDDWMGAGGIWKGPVAIGPEKTLRKVAENRQE